MNYRWNKYDFLIILIPVAIAGIFFLASRDTVYILRIGYSLMNRQDVGSIERFIFQYGGQGPLVYLLMMLMGIWIPNLSLVFLFRAGNLLYVPPLVIIYVLIGGSVGVFYISRCTMGIRKILVGQFYSFGKTVKLQKSSTDDYFTKVKGLPYLISIFLVITPFLSSLLYWGSLMVGGLLFNSERRGLFIASGILGLLIFNFYQLII